MTSSTTAPHASGAVADCLQLASVLDCARTVASLGTAHVGRVRGTSPMPKTRAGAGSPPPDRNATTGEMAAQAVTAAAGAAVSPLAVRRGGGGAGWLLPAEPRTAPADEREGRRAQGVGAAATCTLLLLTSQSVRIGLSGHIETA